MEKNNPEIAQLEGMSNQMNSAKKSTGYALCGIGIFVFAVTLLVAINAKNLFLFIIGIIEVAVLVGAGILLIRNSRKKQEIAVEKPKEYMKEKHVHSKKKKSVKIKKRK